MGSGSGSLLKVIAKNFDVLVGPLVALAYPLFFFTGSRETLCWLETGERQTSVEGTAHRLPFWPSMKLIFICWLVLPYFNGAAYVYQKYVKPFFVKNQMVNIWYVPQKKGLLGKSDDFLRTLDKFVEENGTDALKKLANQAGKSFKPSKSSKDSKEQKRVLKDLKQLKKALKDSKEQGSLKDSNESKPKNNKRVTFAEVEPEKEFKASNSNWHPSPEYHSGYPEQNSWTSSFMFFEDENSYWNQNHAI